MDLDALLGLLFFVVFVVVPMITGARKRGQGRAGQPGQPGQGRAGQQTTGQGAGGPSQPRQRQVGQGPPGGPATSTTQGTQRPGSQANTASTAQRGDHPATTTLEEIRRRVQEAQERERQRDAERAQGRRGGQTASTQRSASRGLVSSDPFERGLVTGSGKTISGDLIGMGREGASSQWPPPAYDPLAGQPPSSVLGREGQRAQPPSGVLGREGQRAQPPRSSVQRRATGGLGREGATGLGDMPASQRASIGREGVARRSERAAAAEIGSSAQPARTVSGARLGRAGLVTADREGILRGLIWHEILSDAPSKKLFRRTRSRPQ